MVVAAAGVVVAEAGVVVVAVVVVVEAGVVVVVVAVTVEAATGATVAVAGTVAAEATEGTVVAEGMVAVTAEVAAVIMVAARTEAAVTATAEVTLALVAATMALTRVVVRAAVPISAAEVVAAKAEAPRVFPARAQRGPRAPFQPVQKPQVAPRHVVIEADLPGQTCRCPRTKIGAMGTARRSRTIRSTSQRTNAMLGATRGTDRSPQTITKTVFGCGRKQ